MTRLDALAQAGKLPQQVTLGIRPFYVSLSLTKDQTHTIPASVFVVEPLGDSAVVTVEVADTRMQVVTEPYFRADLKQSVWLSFEPDRTILFDTVTEKALTNSI